jgi:hypothetical protein
MSRLSASELPVDGAIMFGYGVGAQYCHSLFCHMLESLGKNHSPSKGVFMIAVTGATGHLGRFIIAALLKKVSASGIDAAVRNVEKAKKPLGSSLAA